MIFRLCITRTTLILQTGFRHLPLHDEQMSQYLFSTLFVRIGLRDA